AREAGAHGIVCSGRELRLIRANLDPRLMTIVPGIRPRWGSIEADDQKRIATPKDAITAGADYLVIGRPIRDAHDPIEAAKKIAQEISEAF
ncbi:MAG TPA: orotidine-5'-phosphate decarboxylase, partial [Desulfobacterales bacterium]|nr:orotidine-5'-phosphate decarboxylase [Desulfobacterales bacterium]